MSTALIDGATIAVLDAARTLRDLESISMCLAILPGLGEA
jgi:hypothetical protein